MNRFQQPKSSSQQRIPQVQSVLLPDTKASPKPASNLQQPLSLRIQSPKPVNQVQNRTFFQAKTPGKIHDTNIKSPPVHTFKQRETFYGELHMQQARAKGKENKSPMKKEINNKRLSIQPKTIGLPLDKTNSRSSHKFFPEKHIKTEEADDQRVSIRLSVLDTNYDETDFNIPQESKIEFNNFVHHDNTLKINKEQPKPVTPKAVTKSPRLDSKGARRDLKNDFSPNRQVKANAMKDSQAQKRCVTSPGGDDDTRKRKMSINEKAIPKKTNKTGSNGFQQQECLTEACSPHTEAKIIYYDLGGQSKTPKKALNEHHHHQQVKTNTVKMEVQIDKAELGKRREEVSFYINQLEEKLTEIPKIREELFTEHRQRQDTIEGMKDDIRKFAEKLIDAVHDQAETTIVHLEEEFAQGMSDIKQATVVLESCRDRLFDMKKHMDKNINSILQAARSEHLKLKEKCMDTCNTFQDVVNEIQNVLKEPINVDPSERILSFKKSIKNTLSEMFNDSYFEGTAGTAGSTTLPELKNFEDFDKFMKSEESEDALKIKPGRDKPQIYISFDNKDIFQNTLQVSAKTVPVPEPQETRARAISENLFRTNSDFSTMIFSGGNDTPRLYRESELEFEEVKFNEEQEDMATMGDFLGSDTDEDQYDGMDQSGVDEAKLDRYEKILQSVTQKQNKRSDYLRGGRNTPQNAELDIWRHFIENKLKEEGIRETSFQKSLFQSPSFKEV